MMVWNKCTYVASAVLVLLSLSILLCEAEDSEDREGDNHGCERLLGARGYTAVTASANLTAGPCGLVMPPIKLLQTGTNIIDPQSAEKMAEFTMAGCATGGLPTKNCIAPPAYYRKYTNLYTTNYKTGVAILAPADVPEASIMRVRHGINQLFKWMSRTIPGLREHIGNAYIRVLINPCSNGKNWVAHPEVNDAAQEIGGGSRFFPSTGAEELGIPLSQCFRTTFPAALEEVIHSIHDVAIKELDYDAYIAIICLATKDSEDATYTGDNGPTAHADALASSVQKRVEAVLELFDDDLVSTVSYEYFVGVVGVWIGLPLGDYHLPGNNISRAAIKIHRPHVACIIARYFPDVGEADGSYCIPGTKNDTSCSKFPGSCYCGNMTAEYLGAAISRARCASLQQIKEDAYGSKNLPASRTTGNLNCTGCARPGCDTDRGDLSLQAEGTGAISPTNSTSAAAILLTPTTLPLAVFSLILTCISFNLI